MEEKKEHYRRVLNVESKKEYDAFMQLIVSFSEAFRLLSLDLFHSREEYRSFWNLMKDMVKNNERQFLDSIKNPGGYYSFTFFLNLYYEDYIFPLNIRPSGARRGKSEEKVQFRRLNEITGDIFKLLLIIFPETKKGIEESRDLAVSVIKESFEGSIFDFGTIEGRRKKMKCHCATIHYVFDLILRLIILYPEGEWYKDYGRFELMYPETCGRDEIDEQMKKFLVYRTKREQEGATYKDQIRREDDIKRRRKQKLGMPLEK